MYLKVKNSILSKNRVPTGTKGRIKVRLIYFEVKMQRVMCMYCF